MCLCHIYYCPNTKSSTSGTAISTELFLNGSYIFATLIKETDLADDHYKLSKLEGFFWIIYFLQIVFLLLERK